MPAAQPDASVPDAPDARLGTDASVPDTPDPREGPDASVPDAAEAPALGAGTLGVWTRAAAVARFGRGKVDRRVRNGTWQSPWPGVLAEGGVVLDAEQRAAAALIASGGFGSRRSPTKKKTIVAAVASGRTAARCWGLPLIDDRDPATGADEERLDDVHTWTRQRNLIVAGEPQRELHRHRLTLQAGDLRRLDCGIWILSPARTLFDCARLLTHEALVCAIDAALHDELCTLAELQAMADAHLGDEGAPAFRAAVSAADGRSESPGETLTRLLLLPVLPALEPQVKIVNEQGWILARVDLGDREVLLAVEFDGKKAHEGERMVARDRRRDRGIWRRGWWTERVTWFEVRRQPAATRARILEEHARCAARARLRG